MKTLIDLGKFALYTALTYLVFVFLVYFIQNITYWGK